MDKNIKKKAQARASAVSAYHDVFNGRSGELVLHDLMRAHHVLSPAFPVSGDVNTLVYNEGARSVVLRILTLLKTDPKQFLERIEKYESEND